ncbi:MAG: hypothetical protein JNM52_05855 [Betaproteobacteria bacterium]|nr:hypothetical protein [Betaproteobacteria bacterium]
MNLKAVAIAAIGATLLLAAPSTPPTPLGWVLEGDSATHEYYYQSAVSYTGQPSLTLKAKSATSDQMAFLEQTMDASRYRGKRIRLSGVSKANSVTKARLSILISDFTEGLLADRANQLPYSGTHDWTPFSIVIDVAEQAETIWVTVELQSGQLWVDQLVIESVTQDMALTPYRTYTQQTSTSSDSAGAAPNVLFAEKPVDIDVRL